MIRRWIVIVVAGLWALPLAAAEGEAAKGSAPGYVDLNRDGVNDLFRDADGDGVNDVTKKPYPHHFRYVDENHDGVNEVFVDQDGDGVNDLEARNLDRDGDGICDNVIDNDGDQVNDITGRPYSRRSLNGFQYGMVDEERGMVHRQFVDEDGDGMYDGRLGSAAHGMDAQMDQFIDEDGDGICDGRTVGGRMRRVPMPGTGGEGMGPGRGHMHNGGDEGENRKGGMP